MVADGVPAPPVDVGDGALYLLVADDHPMPDLLVPAGRGLHGDVNAVLDHLARHRPRKVEPLGAVREVVRSASGPRSSVTPVPFCLRCSGPMAGASARTARHVDAAQ